MNLLKSLVGGGGGSYQPLSTDDAVQQGGAAPAGRGGGGAHAGGGKPAKGPAPPSPVVGRAAAGGGEQGSPGRAVPQAQAVGVPQQAPAPWAGPQRAARTGTGYASTAASVAKRLYQQSKGLPDCGGAVAWVPLGKAANRLVPVLDDLAEISDSGDDPSARDAAEAVLGALEGVEALQAACARLAPASLLICSAGVASRLVEGMCELREGLDKAQACAVGRGASDLSDDLCRVGEEVASKVAGRPSALLEELQGAASAALLAVPAAAKGTPAAEDLISRVLGGGGGPALGPGELAAARVAADARVLEASGAVAEPWPAALRAFAALLGPEGALAAGDHGEDDPTPAPPRESPALPLCPLSGAPVEDPVMLVATGASYDRASLAQWFEAQGAVDPGGSRAPLDSTAVVPDLDLAEEISAARHAASMVGVQAAQAQQAARAAQGASAAGGADIERIVFPPGVRMMELEIAGLGCIQMPADDIDLPGPTPGPGQGLALVAVPVKHLLQALPQLHPRPSLPPEKRAGAGGSEAGGAQPLKIARTLWYLASQPGRAGSLAQAGVIVPLVGLLRRGGDFGEELPRVAAYALQNLSAGSATSKNVVIGAGAIPPLIVLLGGSLLYPQEAALGCLYNLATQKGCEEVVKQAEVVQAAWRVLQLGTQRGQVTAAMFLRRVGTI